MVIAARNEAAKIAEKLDNTLALARAGTELDVMVASDASDDATDRSCWVTRQRDPTRSLAGTQGKRIRTRIGDRDDQRRSDRLTDTGTILPKDALLHVLDAFRDPEVGAVSSIDRFLTVDGTLQGEGAYVRYEMWLRDLETRFQSLVGLSGSFFAARRLSARNGTTGCRVTSALRLAVPSWECGRYPIGK